MKQNKIGKIIAFAGIVAVVAGLSFVGGMNMLDGGDTGHEMSHEKISMENMSEHRDTFISEKKAIIEYLLMNGKYRCCLEKPCVYCIEKSPGHGEGATCNCLEDIVNGENPCGECIGEIMEGNGNPYLAEYFALAIAEKVGMEYLDTLRQIMLDKYGIAVEKQS